MFTLSNCFDAGRIRSSAARWTATASLLLFAFTATYTPVHLLIEKHIDGDCVRCCAQPRRQDAVGQPPCHVPHPAADHVREFLTPGSDFAAVEILAVLPTIFDLPASVESECVANPISEPAFKPPDAPARQFQSRAPPVACL